MIEMELTGVRVELPTNQPIVLLRERGGERYLPIWIGAAEAAAIALSLQGVVTPRPMTHDLMRTILEDLSVDVRRIEVTELRESTFYATIAMNRRARTTRSRPGRPTRSPSPCGCRCRSSSTRTCSRRHRS